jgi:hypothetical protein
MSFEKQQNCEGTQQSGSPIGFGQVHSHAKSFLNLFPAVSTIVATEISSSRILSTDYPLPTGDREVIQV